MTPLEHALNSMNLEDLKRECIVTLPKLTWDISVYEPKKYFVTKVEKAMAAIKESGGGRMVIDAYEKHHCLRLKGKGIEGGIILTTRQANSLSVLAYEKENLGMARIEYWFK